MLCVRVSPLPGKFLSSAIVLIIDMLLLFHASFMLSLAVENYSARSFFFIFVLNLFRFVYICERNIISSSFICLRSQIKFKRDAFQLAIAISTTYCYIVSAPTK